MISVDYSQRIKLTLQKQSVYSNSTENKHSNLKTNLTRLVDEVHYFGGWVVRVQSPFVAKALQTYRTVGAICIIVYVEIL